MSLATLTGQIRKGYLNLEVGGRVRGQNEALEAHIINNLPGDAAAGERWTLRFSEHHFTKETAGELRREARSIAKSHNGRTLQSQAGRKSDGDEENVERG